MPEPDVVVSRTVRVPGRELEVRTDTSGGPGGQHANTSRTRVEVRLDVTRSSAFGPRQRARVLERLGPVVVAVAGDTRSQARNLAIARDRLAARLAEALRPDPAPRRPTRPSAAARKRRVDTKRRHGQRKRGRRPPGTEDDQ